MFNASSIAFKIYDGPGPTQYFIIVVSLADLPLCAAIKVGSSDPSSFLPVTENVLPTLGVVVIPGSNTCNVPGKSLPFEIAAFDAARVKGVIVNEK